MSSLDDFIIHFYDVIPTIHGLLTELANVSNSFKMDYSKVKDYLNERMIRKDFQLTVVVVPKPTTKDDWLIWLEDMKSFQCKLCLDITVVNLDNVHEIDDSSLFSYICITTTSLNISKMLEKLFPSKNLQQLKHLKICSLNYEEPDPNEFLWPQKVTYNIDYHGHIEFIKDLRDLTKADTVVFDVNTFQLYDVLLQYDIGLCRIQIFSQDIGDVRDFFTRLQCKHLQLDFGPHVKLDTRTQVYAALNERLLSNRETVFIIYRKPDLFQELFAYMNPENFSCIVVHDIGQKRTCSLSEPQVSKLKAIQATNENLKDLSSYKESRQRYSNAFETVLLHRDVL